MELLEEMESRFKETEIGLIPKHWEVVRLGDVINSFTPNAKLKQSDYKTFGKFPVIDQSQKFIAGFHDDETMVFNKNLPVILFGDHTRIIKYVNFPFICGADGLKIIVPKENFHRKYFYYALLNLNIPSEGYDRHFKILKERLIPLPPLPEQKAIAEVLSSIDDKIDLLHRQNKTQEEMAMTLFRKWFIELIKDGLPEGWEEVSLGDIFDIGIGRTPPRKESYWFSLNPKDIRWISVKDLGPIDTYIINTSEFLKEESVKKFNIPIIPDNTVVLSFKLTVGRIGITIGEMVSNEAIAHFKLKPDSKISSNYLYLFLKTLDFSTFGSTSSIAEAINSKIIKEIKIHIPDDELITSFQSLINPVFQKIKLNTLEIQTLEKLRDTLLPKLMSGEVRVKF